MSISMYQLYDINESETCVCIDDSDNQAHHVSERQHCTTRVNDSCVHTSQISVIKPLSLHAWLHWAKKHRLPLTTNDIFQMNSCNEKKLTTVPIKMIWLHANAEKELTSKNFTRRKASEFFESCAVFISFRLNHNQNLCLTIHSLEGTVMYNDLAPWIKTNLGTWKLLSQKYYTLPNDTWIGCQGFLIPWYRLADSPDVRCR